MVREQVTNFDSSMPRVLSTRDSMERILTYRQGEKMDNAEYVKNLVALIKVFEQYSGTYGLYPKDLVEIDRQVEAATNENGGALTAPEKTKLKAEMIRSAREKAVATQIIAGADKKRYASLRRTLATMFGLKDNKYPVTIDGAINALNIHERQLPPHIKKLSGINLLQTGKEQVAGTDGKIIERITCHKCKNVGHYANKCPQAEPEAKAEKEEVSTHILSQSHRISDQDHTDHIQLTSPTVTLGRDLILLDSQSSVHVFNNKELLTQVRMHPKGKTLTVYTNGGQMVSEMVGKFGDLDVWYNPNSIANILSLALIVERHRVFFDSKIEHAFLLCLTNKLYQV
jgi:hypothetical protein